MDTGNPVNRFARPVGIVRKGKQLAHGIEWKPEIPALANERQSPCIDVAVDAPTGGAAFRLPCKQGHDLCCEPKKP